MKSLNKQERPGWPVNVIMNEHLVMKFSGYIDMQGIIIESCVLIIRVLLDLN